MYINTNPKPQTPRTPKVPTILDKPITKDFRHYPSGLMFSGLLEKDAAEQNYARHFYEEWDEGQPLPFPHPMYTHWGPKRGMPPSISVDLFNCWLKHKKLLK